VRVKHTIKEEAYLKPDRRVGLGLRPGVKTAQEGLLYSVTFNSLAPGCGLALEVDGLNLSPAGLVKLGGEGRAASYASVDWPCPAEPNRIREDICRTCRFLLYLLTPALFKATEPGFWSWKPNDWTPAGLPSSAELKGFACAGYSDYGGWDLVKRRPRPMKCCVNAGSVYFFECRNDLTEDQLEKLFEERWFRAMPGDYANVGVGITLIGVWDYV